MIRARLQATRRPRLRGLVLFAALLAAGAAQALSIGNASLQSRIGEPLRVSIALGNLGSLDRSEIIVRRAPESDYAGANVDRASFTQPLAFELTVDGKGEANVKISTEQPVSEPFVDMVIEVRWPTGRLVKQFTLLLDLPPQ